MIAPPPIFTLRRLRGHATIPRVMAISCLRYHGRVILMMISRDDFAETAE